ncbi:SGNH/GDSL hydrolase family protein [Sphingobium herbicidovorans]|nr:SGNH/GDSL hydrolase family protein [Sphingobium herbicidovorans]
MLVTIVSLGLAGCATTGQDKGSADWAGAGYVAMGSSFAAGAGIGALQPGSPARCGRTVNNYASLLAQRLQLVLTDVSCGGAVTANVLDPWSKLPAQIEAVTPDTRLVTITIGGNDVGYAMGLMGASCRAGASFGSGSCIPKPATDEDDWRKLEQNLTTISRQVAARAPKARLIFVQYVTLVPPTLCDAAVLSGAEAKEYRALGERLAAVTARVARANGATVLPADKSSRDHTACSAEPWSHGMNPHYDLKQGAPWHPTRAGHAAIAQALAVLL